MTLGLTRGRWIAANLHVLFLYCDYLWFLLPTLLLLVRLVRAVSVSYLLGVYPLAYLLFVDRRVGKKKNTKKYKKKQYGNYISSENTLKQRKHVLLWTNVEWFHCSICLFEKKVRFVPKQSSV
uniref:(northern house mosquito) hypothetical protein n=1 Tax=Culex pipiens TaxID=7175 RepID=A0A8D8E6Q1_CULPI